MIGEDGNQPEMEARAQAADRFYGVFLLVLAFVSLIAPAFGGAVLAWALTLAGITGGCWLLLDRSPRGFFAAIGWALVSLALGLQLVMPGTLPVDILALTLTLGFVTLGLAEIVFGLRRFRPHSAPRLTLILGGAAAIVFGAALSWAAPALPAWLAGAVLGLVFASFGLAVLFGSKRRRAKGAIVLKV